MAGSGAALVVEGSGRAEVDAGTGTTVAVTAGAVEVLCAVAVASGAEDEEAAVWMNAPPGTEEATEEELSGSALEVDAGAVSEVVVATTATLEESDDPEPPETKDSLVVRVSMVVDEQELGPEDQPMRRLATSDA